MAIKRIFSLLCILFCLPFFGFAQQAVGKIDYLAGWVDLFSIGGRARGCTIPRDHVGRVGSSETR